MDKLCETTILDLNDDCLGEICKYLDQYDQVEFGLCCQRFEAVFKLFCKENHSIVFVGEFSQQSEGFCEKYFQLAGSFFNHINLYAKPRVDELIVKYCPNVKEIRYSDKFVDKSLIYLLKDIKTLESLYFDNCNFNADCSAISETQTTNEKHSCFRNLKILSFNKCNGNDMGYVSALLTEELRTLKIIECYSNSASFLLELTQHCPKLNKFCFTCDEDFDQNVYSNLFMQLPDLKDLDVKDCTYNFFKALAEHASDQLETLKLEYELDIDFRNFIVKFQNLKELSVYGGCWSTFRDFVALKSLEEICLEFCSVTSECILHMLQNCPKLILIDIQHNNKIIEPNIINQVIKFLDNHAQRKEPVLLLLCIEGLTNDYLQTPEYLATKHILELVLLECVECNRSV